MLKKILIGFGTLVLVLIAVLVILLITVDVDRYKPRIEQAVHDKLDRTLKFDGSCRCRYFPRSRGAAAHHLERARYGRALPEPGPGPRVAGACAAAVGAAGGVRRPCTDCGQRSKRRADGTSNLDDLIGAPQPKPKVEPTPSESAGAKAHQFRTGGIDVVDAQVTYRDDARAQHGDVSRLNLKTGRLATRATPPSISRRPLPPPSRRPTSSCRRKRRPISTWSITYLAAREIEARARGRSGADQFDVALTAPKVGLDAARVAGGPVKLVATVTGGHQVHAELALQNLAGTGNKFSIGKNRRRSGPRLARAAAEIARN